MSARNILLRICKALLRRLSRVRHCQFRYRVQLLLTLIFHNVSELSGVNLAGTFTPYLANMQSGCTEDLYQAVWNSHNSMLNPISMFKPQKTARKCFEDLDKVLSNIKPERLANIAGFSPERLCSPEAINYLLKDKSFVREFLVQVRILAHTLQIPVKQTQKEAFTLSEEEHKSLVKLDTAAARLLTQVDAGTAKLVTRTLIHEDHWATWKDQKCKGFDRPPAESISVANGTSVVEVAGPEPGEVEGTPAPPSILTFHENEPGLEDYITQVEQDEDPEEEVDEPYKKKNDPVFTWRMLRLVSERSVCSFEKIYNGNVVDIAREMKGKRPREDDTDSGYKQPKQ